MVAYVCTHHLCTYSNPWFWFECPLKKIRDNFWPFPTAIRHSYCMWDLETNTHNNHTGETKVRIWQEMVEKTLAPATYRITFLIFLQGFLVWLWFKYIIIQGVKTRKTRLPMTFSERQFYHDGSVTCNQLVLQVMSRRHYNHIQKTL